jgi:hypothetical protein
LRKESEMDGVFVRWDCDNDGSFDGCIGILLPPAQAFPNPSDETRLGSCLVIHSCTHVPGNGVHQTGMHLRQKCEGKDWKPLTPEEVSHTAALLDRLLRYGQNMAAVHNLIYRKDGA